MKAIETSEILPLGEYEAVRPRFRARVIDEKKPRRVTLGELVSVLFENRDSVLLQVQEMLRTERITAPAAILHEIETYNDLLPGPGQLSLTVFIEIPDRATRERMLVELAGIEDTFGVQVDGRLFLATGKRPAGYVDGRTTAVHYLKATLDHEAVAAITGGDAEVALVVKHPKLRIVAQLGRATVAKLAEDLRAS
jgi:hypothetical protein